MTGLRFVVRRGDGSVIAVVPVDSTWAEAEAWGYLASKADREKGEGMQGGAVLATIRCRLERDCRRPATGWRLDRPGCHEHLHREVMRDRGERELGLPRRRERT